MLLDGCERTAVSSLDDLIERLADIRRMRAAYGGDYRRLISGCEFCQAPPGWHWPDCDPNAEEC